MKVSVIIPTLNRDQYLKDIVYDLLNQNTKYSFEVIVADQNNLSPKERGEELFSLSQKDHLRWVSLPGNNVVLARNKSINIAKGEIIIFLDDDIRIEDKNFLDKHIQAYSDGPENIAAVCGREVNPGGVEFSYGLNYERKNPISDILFFPRNYSRKIKAVILSTVNCSVKKKVLIEVGCFDENFFGISYGEDSDLALRINKKKFKIIYDPQPKVIHFMAKTGGVVSG